MGFKYEVTEFEPDKKYHVWEHEKIRTECRTPGVYLIFDIEGEVIYVGESGNGEVDRVGDRVSNHIKGATTESKRGMQRRIYEIYIYEFENTPSDKFDKSICELYAKKYYDRAIFSKDDFNYDSEDTINYLRDETRLWKNWHKHFTKGGIYQQNIVDSGLTLE
ncbi:GIY-YIG nuclease family protein [Bacillus sp. 1P10SD]|uniref:GIY-YIG nuclease family protein n=1 Tax=Bacillus sp. 1P10SD TaxID=3132265 RepID=UPI0039A4E599